MEWTGTEGKVVRPPPSLPPSVARVALKSIAPSIHPFMMMRVASLDDLQSVRSQIRPGLPQPSSLRFAQLGTPALGTLLELIVARLS